MNTLPFQAVAFDLDDTLLLDNLTISDYTIGTLRALSENGVYIIPVSGRSLRSMKPFVDQIACVTWFVSCNGAEIWNTAGGLFRGEKFSVELGHEIAAFGKNWQCYAQTYDGEYFYYNEESVWAERYAKSSMLKGIRVGDLEEFIQEPRNKILMMDDEKKIAEMLTAARSQFEGRASVTCSKPWFLEFNPVLATKGIALQRIAEQLGLELSRFIAFGDGLNDLSMLQNAGKGVLMANGQKSIRPLCDDVCLSNQEDGVARYLRSEFREVFP